MELSESIEMDKKYSSVHYDKYLELKKILNAQNLRSEKLGKPAHDEMLFIITHQVYELWFKEIIHDLTSVMDIFKQEVVDDKAIGIANHLLERITVIQQVLIDQIKILETMTPLDFLDFRNYLLPASGFQSYQFRIVELALGLKKEERLSYQKEYASVFSEEQQAYIKDLEEGRSLVELLNDWLERTPFLTFNRFDFLEKYKEAVSNMLNAEKEAIQNTDYISQEDKDLRYKMIGDTETYFDAVFNKERHTQLVEDGKLRFSYGATMSALFINLYRDEPVLQLPYRLLRTCVEIDEQFTTWRYRHAQMVLRMLGKKMGTGGSSGYDYLQATTEKHRIFSDLHNISTLLIPRSELPELTDDLKKELGYYYTSH